MTLDPKEIGQRIAHARIRKGWTQLAFALEADVSPSTVTRWEAGKLPAVRELMRLAELLEISPEELVEPGDAGRDERLDRLERAAKAASLSLEGLERGIKQILERLDAQDEQANPGPPRRRPSK